MASEIRVNKLNSQTGVGTITLSPTGVDISGVTTVSTLRSNIGIFSGTVTGEHHGDGSNLTGVASTENIRTNTNATFLQNINVSGTVTATSYGGSGASLTNLPAANLTGTLPAISAANLTNIPAANVTVTLPALTAANLTNIPAANIVGVATAGFERTGGFSGGKILQVVQATTTGTNNYASVDFQNTVITVNITPTASDSKFLVKSVVQFGIGSKQCAVSFNFSDSLHASGTTHPIAPMSGDGTNGASNSRLPAYFGIGSFDDASDVDNYFVGNATGEYLYTPAYQNTNARAFTVMVRSSFGDNVRFNMNAHYNAANPRDMRPMSSITVMEVAA